MYFIAERGLCYCLNKIFIALPVFIMSNFIYYSFYSEFYPEIISGENGWGFLYILEYSFLLPKGAYSFYKSFYYGSADKLHMLSLVLSIVFAYVLIETIITYLFKGDLGNLIFKLRVYRKGNKKPTFLKILLRTTIKYLSIAFFLPILLFPLFNKKRLFLHEIISSICKCDKDEIIPPKNINDQEGEYSPYFMG